MTAEGTVGAPTCLYKVFVALLTLMNKGEREVKRKKREERGGKTEGETKREGWGQRERGDCFGVLDEQFGYAM
jgi:hypothetical protein